MLDSTKALEDMARQLDTCDDINVVQAMWILMGFKNFTRLSRKDDWKAELTKVENYFHKARTGEWNEALRPTHYGGTLENADNSEDGKVHRVCDKPGCSEPV